MSTTEKVISVICEQLGIETDEVKMESDIVKDLGADSLDVVELVMAFEEEFEVEIPDDAAEKLKTVEDAIRYVEQQVNN